MVTCEGLTAFSSRLPVCRDTYASAGAVLCRDTCEKSQTSHISAAPDIAEAQLLRAIRAVDIFLVSRKA